MDKIQKHPIPMATHFAASGSLMAHHQKAPHLLLTILSTGEGTLTPNINFTNGAIHESSIKPRRIEIRDQISSTHFQFRKFVRRMRCGGGDQSGSVDRHNEATDRYNSVYRGGMRCGPTRK